MDEKEIQLRCALEDLKKAVEVHGVHKVISSMDEGTYWHFYKWFDDMYDFRLGNKE